MPAPLAVSARPTRERWPLLVAAGVAAVYVGGHGSWFLGTPLGRVPVLDARENLALANAIAAGTVAAEPFYRAPGYALVLALFRTAGVSAAGLFTAALVLGGVLHVLNSAIAARIAQAWFDARTAVVAGLLVALNPVLIHFALQAGDATPALTCFLAGLSVLAPEIASDVVLAPRRSRWLGASLWWAAATLLRPNYLLVWLTLPLLAGRELRRRKRTAHDSDLPGWPLMSAACTGILLFGALGEWQHRISGRFGFLPAQGAYNLWAANKPGAHGRYFVQSVALPADVAVQNPARAESMILYAQETGQPAQDLTQANRYWRARFLAYATRHPLSWINLLARKTYALLNDWEQYNNETPAFHIARSPWLRWNPLSWGVLLVLGVAGAARLGAELRAAIAPLAIVAGACAASAVLFFVSARFRLPLVGLMTPLAAAAITGPRFWVAWPVARQLALVGACVAAIVIAFSRFDGVHDAGTFVQDHVLLARAAETTGHDLQCWRESNAALATRPDHPDALRLAVSSYFNLLLDNRASASDEAPWRAAAGRLLATSTADAPDLRAVAILSLWRAGRRDAAVEAWRELPATPSAIAARLLVGDRTLRVSDLSHVPESAWQQPLVRIAGAEFQVTPADASAILPPAAASAAIARIFGTPASPP